jgi:tetratricopeptide (TPR) repeat protein
LAACKTRWVDLADETENKPDRTEIEACLKRILASEPFREAVQLTAFLRFSVTETLEGRGDDLKGYTIATMALGRPESFDPQTDPIVRVQAGRLRQALAEYYTDHPQETVEIVLQRGNYAASFQRRVPGQVSGIITPSPTAPPPVTHVAVSTKTTQSQDINRRLLLAAATGSALAVAGAVYLFRPQRPALTTPKLITEIPPVESYFPTLAVEQDVVGLPDFTDVFHRTREAISRFDDLVLVEEAASSDMMSATSQKRRPGWSLVLKLNVRSAGPDELRISARLVDRIDQRLIWSREFDAMQSGPEGDASRSAIVRMIATTIAQPYGVIHAHVRQHLATGQAQKDPFRCIVDSFDYWNINDPKTHGAARACLFDRIADYPSFGPLHAQLAYLHLEEFRHGYNPMPGDAITRAIDSAKTGVKLSPTSARAHQSLMAAYFVAGDLEGAWRSAADATRLNPFDTEIIADVGSYHVLAGNYENGLGYLTLAMQLNPAPPVWVITFRAIALYMLGRLEQSGPMVLGLQGANYPVAMIALVMASLQFRDAAGGKRHLDRLRNAHPDIVADMPAFLRKIGFQQAAADRILTDYRRAVSWITGQ